MMEDCSVKASRDLARKWPYRKDVPRMAFFITRFLVTLHKQRSIAVDLLPTNVLRFYDALLEGKISEADIMYDVDGIVCIDGLKLDTNSGTLVVAR